MGLLVPLSCSCRLLRVVVVVCCLCCLRLSLRSALIRGFAGRAGAFWCLCFVLLCLWGLSLRLALICGFAGRAVAFVGFVCLWLLT